MSFFERIKQSLISKENDKIDSHVDIIARCSRRLDSFKILQRASTKEEYIEIIENSIAITRALLATNAVIETQHPKLDKVLIQIPSSSSSVDITFPVLDYSNKRTLY